MGYGIRNGRKPNVHEDFASGAGGPSPLIQAHVRYTNGLEALNGRSVAAVQWAPGGAGPGGAPGHVARLHQIAHVTLLRRMRDPRQSIRQRAAADDV